MKVNKKLPFYLVCDNIRSLENIGSIFRTADALSVDKIFLGGICGCPPNDKISKTALGAEKSVSWEHHWQIWRVLDKLKKERVSIIALEQTKKSLPYSWIIGKSRSSYPFAHVWYKRVFKCLSCFWCSWILY